MRYAVTEIIVEEKLGVVQTKDSKVQNVEDQYGNHELAALLYFLEGSSRLKAQTLTIQSLQAVIQIFIPRFLTDCHTMREATWSRTIQATQVE